MEEMDGQFQRQRKRQSLGGGRASVSLPSRYLVGLSLCKVQQFHVSRRLKAYGKEGRKQTSGHSHGSFMYL